MCPMAKAIAAEVAAKLGVSYREVNLATAEGKNEGLAFDILSAPSIAFGDEIIARGHLVSKQRLEQEVSERIEKWKARSSPI